MISLRLNQATFEVFSKLMIQVLFGGEELTDNLLMVFEE